jgi:hypothetical protein
MRRVLLLPLLFACGNNGGGQDATGGSDAMVIPPDCIEAENHSDLTWIQQNVFAHQCTFSGCHNGDGTPMGMMDLTSVAMAEARTVNVKAGLGFAGSSSASACDPGCAFACGSNSAGGSQFIVLPGHPEESWLMKMIAAIPDTTPSSCGINPKVGTMPMNDGGVPLCSQKIGAIQRWIAAGAPPQ